MENFFYAFHSTFCHSNKTTNSGMPLTALFDFKDVCVPPQPPTYTSCKREGSHFCTWIQGLQQEVGRDGYKQHGLYNKIPFEKIYVTLSIKMKVFTSTWISFCSPAPTCTWSGHFWKRTRAWTRNPKGSFTGDARGANKLTSVSIVLLWASLFNTLSTWKEEKEPNIQTKLITCHKLFSTQDIL